MSGAIDVENVRSEFPIFFRTINGNPLAYLDSAASAQKPRAVLKAMESFSFHSYSNVHRGLHTLSNEATAGYEASRERVREFLGARHADEIVFTRGATEALNLVASSFGSQVIEPGDEILLTQLEHHANIVPWHFLRARNHARLVWVPVNAEGGLDIDTFRSKLSSRTKIIAITGMGNVNGATVPLRDIVELARVRSIPVVADASQLAVHGPMDVNELGVDFLVFTGHKLYGPTGIGVLYARSEHLAEMPPYQGGGGMVDDVSADEVIYGDPPARFEAGTPPIVEAIGLAAAIGFVEQVGWGRIRAHEAAVGERLLAGFDELSGYTLVPTPRDSHLIFSFCHDRAHAHDIATLVDQEGVAVRAGTHCASPLLKAWGMDAVCRASIGMYTNFDEVDRLLDALKKAGDFFR